MEWEVVGSKGGQTLVSHQTLQICTILNLLIKATRKIWGNRLEVLESTYPIRRKALTQLTWRCPLSYTQRDRNSYKQVDSKVADPKVVRTSESLITNTIISKVIYQNKYRYRHIHRKVMQDLFKFKVKASTNRVALRWECCNKNKQEKNSFKCKMKPNPFMERILSQVFSPRLATVMTIVHTSKI